MKKCIKCNENAKSGTPPNIYHPIGVTHKLLLYIIYFCIYYGFWGSIGYILNSENLYTFIYAYVGKCTRAEIVCRLIRICVFPWIQYKTYPICRDTQCAYKYGMRMYSNIHIMC